jgi:cellulose synthase/poly-beta-1,6-N-acetylglucosamine synthase-like glycosyltransferase
VNIFSLLLDLTVGGIGGALAFLVGYQLLLALLAWFAPQVTTLAADGSGAESKFVILIPAHNEEVLLPALLASLQQLAYPQTHYTVHVVADNCQDRTAALAQAAGAVVHERFNTSAVGKGHALQWLLGQIEEAHIPYDAAVIIDADSIVEPNFLTVMDAHLTQGAQVIQAHYAVRNPERSWVTRLRAAALTLVHYVRPLGRTMIGGSVGLKGNGMVFHRSILMQHQWSGSVTEDIDYHMALVLAGERVVFAADAVVWAEMPGTLQGAYSQNMRWEQGRLQLAHQYIPRLLRSTVRDLQHHHWRAAVVKLDSIMEHLIPPFAVLFGLMWVYLCIALLVPSPTGSGIVSFLFVGQCLYLLAGLRLAQTPRQTYWALGYVPIFLVWKLWLYGRIMVRNLLGREGQSWVRTARDEV